MRIEIKGVGLKRGNKMQEIVFQLSAPLAQSETSREFVQMITGEIRDSEVNRALGRIDASLIQVGRIADAGEDLFELMDSESSELADYHSAFFKSHACDYKDSIRAQFVDIVFLDFLIIHCVEVQPEFRGHRLGLMSVSRLIDLFGDNCGLVVLKPCG